jgi:flagellar protein FlgJ
MLDNLAPSPGAARAATSEPATPVAPNPAPAHDPAYVKLATRAAVDFESFFIGQMLHQMRSATRELAGPDSVFKDRVNSDMLDLADNMLAGQMAGQRAFGIADAILRQLLPAPLNKSS